MIVRLTSEQIAKMWPAIKYGALQANTVPDGKELEYSNELLKNLYCETYSCWMAYEKIDGETLPYAFLLTTIKDDGLFNSRYLFIDTVYGFRTIDDKVAFADMNLVKQYAKEIGCNSIIGYTANPRVAGLSQMMGYAESTSRKYIFDL